MCLYLSSDIPEFRIAKQPFRVFKRVRVVEDCVKGFYFSKDYYPGVLEYSDFSLERSFCFNYNKDVWSVHKAFHSYSIENIKYTFKFNLLQILDDNNPNRSIMTINEGINIALFTVPKGAEYYYEDGVIASRAIRYEGIYGKIFTKEDFVKYLKYFMNVPLSKVYT